MHVRQKCTWAEEEPFLAGGPAQIPAGGEGKHNIDTRAQCFGSAHTAHAMQTLSNVGEHIQQPGTLESYVRHV